MAWGSLLIAGSNDGLILIGIPLLRPYAWVAFLTMCVTIGTALVIEKMAAGHGVEQAVHWDPLGACRAVPPRGSEVILGRPCDD